ncbi:hypothetical protein WOB59_22525 [Methylocystis sp. IM4]|uniref:hypothetical protein n=1 Tax=Methylocystis sp. IM4 TaxID=3136560 RepID=UPI00311982D1
MNIDVAERHAARGKGLKLRSDLLSQLRSHLRPESDVKAELREIVAKLASFVDQIWDFVGRKRRDPIHQDDMKPDGESRQRLSPSDGVFRRRGPDHKTCSAKYPVPVRHFLARHGRRRAKSVSR